MSDAIFWFFIGFMIAGLLSVVIVGLLFPTWDDWRRRREARDE